MWVVHLPFHFHQSCQPLPRDRYWCSLLRVIPTDGCPIPSCSCFFSVVDPFPPIHVCDSCRWPADAFLPVNPSGSCYILVFQCLQFFRLLDSLHVMILGILHGAFRFNSQLAKRCNFNIFFIGIIMNLPTSSQKHQLIF
ncbi:hypothetical protein KSP40_PGU002476 [Platanthera guangdongensis]|uniref:Uncharacterized protein n=1 Tax=Platanthera guangdongensis TaxID=2320717 RepID=A0ABR2MVX3_9ASPA